MKKKILAGLLTTAMVASMVVGCGGNTSDTGKGGSSKSDSAKGKQSVGIAMPTQALERWNRDGEYLKKQFEDAGYDVLKVDFIEPKKSLRWNPFGIIITNN